MDSLDPKLVQITHMTRDIRHHFRRQLALDGKGMGNRALSEIEEARAIAIQLLELIDAEYELRLANRND